MSGVTPAAALPRLPREIEESERAPAVRHALGARTLHLGPAGSLPLLPLGPALLQALRRARIQSRLAPGLDPAEVSLEAERAGLAAVDARTRQRRPARVSRLGLISRDVAERFQRRIARLVGRHADRLLVVVLDAAGAEVGRSLFGREKDVRFLLVSHKRAVADVLVALAEDAGPEAGPT